MQQLKKAYRERRLVPFVGAGLSFPLEMPGWGTLIDDVCNEFDYELLVEKKEEIKNLIDNYRYLDAVDEMVETGILEDDLKTAICSAIHRKKKNGVGELPDNIYKDLAKINCPVYLTTNYDNYLSDYVGKGPSEITHLFSEFINELHNPIYEAAVYNLHGDYTKPSTIVLSRESYNQLYVESNEFKKVLNYFREHYVLVFIGVSLDDEYIQEVLKVGKGKFRARHYILLANISNEKRRELEKEYDVRVIKYSAESGDHTTGIRDILNEIIYISDEEEMSNFITAKKSDDYIPSMNYRKHERLPLINEVHSAHLKDSKIYAEVQEIKKLQESGQVDEAISKYNQIFQRSVFEPLSMEELALVIKGLLYNYILIRDYHSAKSLIETTYKLPKSRENVDLLSNIVDFYFNSRDFETAYKITKEWYDLYPTDPILYGLKIYTETANDQITYESAIAKLVTDEREIVIETEDDHEKQFIFRLVGELALHHKQYDDAVSLLRKAYEIDDNIFNIEDLGIATYFKAIEKADDGIKIKTSDINLAELNKAVEYFEAGFARAKGNLRRGVFSRVAVPYLRSLFYLGKTLEFDQTYDQLVEYCEDDIAEIRRMKAMSDIQLNKLNLDTVNTLNEIDKALILTEYYNIRKMYEHALAEIKPVADKYFETKEEVVLQLLFTYFNAKQKHQYNEYFEEYGIYWGTSERMPLVQSYYYEINEEYAKAEEVLKNLIKESPVIINYSLLISFYKRTGQNDRIGDVYESIMNGESNIVEQDPEGFYITYHQYLMETNNIEKAYWLFKQAMENIAGSDILKFMEVEIKMRLLDFTDVAEKSLDIFEKYQEYGEMIFAYYAAVGYLHYNNFEKSRYYLDVYKAKGHVDERSAQLVKQLEDKLDVLQKRKQPTKEGRTHLIREIAYRSISNSQIIRIPKNETVVIDTPALYVLFHLGKQELLTDNLKVHVTFTTIEQLQNAYCLSGDEVILKILDYIREKDIFEIKSPTIESEIYIRQNSRREFLDFYDSLNLSLQTCNPLVTAYHLPIGSQEDGKPVILPEGFKTIKILNGEIQIYTGV